MTADELRLIGQRVKARLPGMHGLTMIVEQDEGGPQVLVVGGTDARTGEGVTVRWAMVEPVRDLADVLVELLVMRGIESIPEIKLQEPTCVTLNGFSMRVSELQQNIVARKAPKVDGLLPYSADDADADIQRLCSHLADANTIRELLAEVTRQVREDGQGHMVLLSNNWHRAAAQLMRDRPEPEHIAARCLGRLRVFAHGAPESSEGHQRARAVFEATKPPEPPERGTELAEGPTAVPVED